MTNKPKIAVYALHPIMYQVPIFSALHKYLDTTKKNLESVVFFGDDLSLREVYFKEVSTVFKPDAPYLLDGYNFKFFHNLAKDSRGGFFSRINFGMVKEIISGKYDVVLIHGYETFTSWLLLISAKVIGVKVIWRGEAILRGNEARLSLKNCMKKFLVSHFFSLCDALLYSCSGNKKYIELFNTHNKPLFFIPCAVNNEYFIENKQVLDKFKVREELQIPVNNFVILFCARFTERKRPYDLIRAVGSIENRNITILFVGNGPEKTKMEVLANELGVNTVFTGMKNQSEISKYYKAADLFVIISDYDPSPKALNEAMLFELPVIVTKGIGTADDLVEDNGNGFLVNVGDIDSISSKIQLIYSNNDLAKAMGTRSFEIVSEWNYEKDVQGILSAYEYVAKKSI